MLNVSLLVLALVGLALYVLGSGKLSEVGRIMFFCALLAICVEGWPHAILRFGASR